MPSERAPHLPAACRMKVTLKGIRPPVWRRIEVPTDITFAELHDVLQSVMPWDDSHLHMFKVGDLEISTPDLEWPDVTDETRLRLSDIVRDGVKKFAYEYDLGDEWQHEISIESLFDPDPSTPLPRCTAGKRACPPEDAGGPWGYAEHLASRGKAEDEEWLPEDFDPEAFELNAANARLASLQHVRPSRRAKRPPAPRGH